MEKWIGPLLVKVVLVEPYETSYREDGLPMGLLIFLIVRSQDSSDPREIGTYFGCLVSVWTLSSSRDLAARRVL